MRPRLRTPPRMVAPQSSLEFERQKAGSLEIRLSLLFAYQPELLQLHVLCQRVLKDRNIGVGILPKLEESLVRGLTLYAVASEDFGSALFKISQSTNRFVHRQAARVDNLLELRRSFFPVLRGQVRFSTYVNRIQVVREIYIARHA